MFKLFSKNSIVKKAPCTYILKTNSLATEQENQINYYKLTQKTRRTRLTQETRDKQSEQQQQ